MGTGVFCTKEEMKQVMEMASNARVSQLTTTRLGNNADALWHEVGQLVHDFALSHGLPDIKGFYGLGLDGQFIAPDGEEA